MDAALRLDTEGSADQAPSRIPDQMRRNREVRERQGGTVAGEYIDSGISGEEMGCRPELMRLLTECEAAVAVR